MFCKTCGQPVSDDAMFCKYCGEDLSSQWQEYWKEHKIVDSATSVVVNPEANATPLAKPEHVHVQPTSTQTVSNMNATTEPVKKHDHRSNYSKNNISERPKTAKQPITLALTNVKSDNKSSTETKRPKPVSKKAVRLKKSALTNELVARLKPHRTLLKIIGISLVALILISSLVFAGLKVYNNPTAQLQRAFQAKNTPEVIRLYQTTWRHYPEGNEYKLIENYLKAQIDAIFKDAVAGKITTAEAREKFNAINETKLASVDQALTEARQNLTKLELSLTTFAAAQEAKSKGDLVKAQELYGQIREDEPLYAEARAAIKSIQEQQVSTIIKEIDALIAEDKHLDAIARLQKEELAFPNNTILQEKLKATQDLWREKQVTDLLNKSKTQLDAGDYTTAIATLATDIGTTDERLTKALTEAKQKYLAYALSRATELAGKSDYDGALEVLNKAITTLPNTDSISAKIKEIEAAKPTLLNTIKPQNQSKFQAITTEISANSGETYVLGNCFSIGAGFFPFDIGDATFKLDGKFSKFTGYIDVLKSKSKGETALRIFGDNKLLYTSPKLQADGNGASVAVNIDVTGVKHLRVITAQSNIPFGGNFEVLIAGWKFYK